MAHMTKEIQDMFERASAVVLATAGNDGIPNAVPVAMKKVIDPETIVISDQYFNKTLDHLKENVQVAVTFWEGNEGYQLKGLATYENEGPRFDEVAQMVAEKAAAIGVPLKSKGACFIKIDNIYSVSPGPTAGELIA